MMMERFINNEDIIICTESFGNPQDPAIVLIMGSGSSLLWWDIQWCQLLVQQGYFVIRYDLRDTGKSTTYPHFKPGYDLNDLADDVITIMDEYQLDQTILIGMSLGGLIAQTVACRYPNRVKGMVLWSSICMTQTGLLPVYSDEVKAALGRVNQQVPEQLDDYVANIFQQWAITHQSQRRYNINDVKEMIRQDILRANDYQSRLNHSVITLNPDAVNTLKQLTIPTLILQGDMDVVAPKIHGETLHQLISGSNLMILSGMGHEVHPDDYQTVLEKMKTIFY